MKKIAVSLLAVIIGTIANAAYMYWQIDSSAVEQGGISVGDGSYAKIVASTSSTYSESGTTTLNSSYLYFDETSQKVVSSSAAETTASGYWSNDNYANLSGLTNSGEGYTYFVEIYNSSNLLLGHSQGVAYSDIGLASALGDISSATLANTFQGVAYSVPEPTGAMLMLFGLAMLGLKRRKA